jgi:hypothetical protein
MKSSLFLIILLLIPPVASFYGYLFLAQSVAKTSKKYRIFILKLKKQGIYEEWVHQHKYLVLLDKIFQYIKAGFIVLVLIGFAIKFASTSKIVITILEVIGYVYWPLVFILMVTISNLYKKVPEIQG